MQLESWFVGEVYFSQASDALQGQRMRTPHASPRTPQGERRRARQGHARGSLVLWLSDESAMTIHDRFFVTSWSRRWSTLKNGLRPHDHSLVRRGIDLTYDSYTWFLFYMTVITDKLMRIHWYWDACRGLCPLKMYIRTNVKWTILNVEDVWSGETSEKTGAQLLKLIGAA